LITTRWMFIARREVPSDYGLSWSVLLVSPVTGALSGWAGLLLLQALQKLDVIDLAGLLRRTSTSPRRRGPRTRSRSRRRTPRAPRPRPPSRRRAPSCTPDRRRPWDLAVSRS
jgi:hypothetical protein